MMVDEDHDLDVAEMLKEVISHNGEEFMDTLTKGGAGQMAKYVVVQSGEGIMGIWLRSGAHFQKLPNRIQICGPRWGTAWIHPLYKRRHRCR